MSKADSLFDWWANLPRSLRPNPFSYNERDDVELAQFQATLREHLEGLQATLERPFGEQQKRLHRDLQEAYSRVADELDRAKVRFGSAHSELDFFSPQGKLRLTWRPILPQVLDWLEDLKTLVLAAKKQPLKRPFLSVVGADPECLDVPDFHQICGFWSDNYFIGHYPWRRLSWDAVLEGPPSFDDRISPQGVAASMVETIWNDVLDALSGDVRKGHKAVKDCPWTIPHALCELTRPDSGGESPDMPEEMTDRVCWATSLHVPFRRWLHTEGEKHDIDSPLDRTGCYPTWPGFVGIVGDDPTGMIGGISGHRRACFFAFLLDELSKIWDKRKTGDAEDRSYKKAWHGEAIAYLTRHPDASAADVARAVGVSRTTISRDERMKTLFTGRMQRLKGFSDGKGYVDGYVEPESFED
ncbi:MAG: hypothetical protein R3E76_07910 [Planctomycetota bacterium]